MRPQVRINFSDFWHPDTLEAKRANPLFRLLSKRFEVEICDRPDFLIFSCFGVNFISHKGVRIYYTGENVPPNYAHCDWAFGFDYCDDPRHFRLPYYAFCNWSSLLQDRDVEALMARKSRFCAFVYSNGHPRERLRFLDKLSRYKAVDCGGKVRNNIGYLVPDKIAFLQAYKFSIAFENESHPGYTTEKLPEAFAGRTVPIYWGNPLIGREFNACAFINSHDFRNLDQVVDFVVEMDRNDDLYRKYLGALPFSNGQPNEYLNENKILDRFEEIFTTRLRPRAQTLRGRVADLLLEPRRFRRQLRKRLSHKG
jgi:hypothetical protein